MSERGLGSPVGQYAVVTLGYWAFTLSDGALRMLVVLFLHGIGFSPLQIALAFVIYEFCGVVTNLTGGWLGARFGLNLSMQAGFVLQIIALTMLAVGPSLLTLGWVMVSQALAGIAKDLNKNAAKSSLRVLLPEGGGRLYRWVALLTGSKNALKGAGFFLGGLLLATLGFRGAVLAMAGGLGIVLLLGLLLLRADLGRAKDKPKFSDLLSSSPAVNILAAARLFLFGSRDVWFVVALPVWLQTVAGWSPQAVGGYLAFWVIGYGGVQALAPAITRRRAAPDGRMAMLWALALAALPLLLAFLVQDAADVTWLTSGLILFALLFAVNSAVHSYLILAWARADGVSLDVGIYYTANAAGRLIGTLLSGWLYQTQGLSACLLAATGFMVATVLISIWLPREEAVKYAE